MRTRSFLLSRTGLQKGYYVPWRLQFFDTLGTLIDILRLPVSVFGAFTVGQCTAQWIVGLGLPRGLAFGIALPLMPIVFYLLWNPRHSVLGTAYRELAILGRLATRSEASHYPLINDSWPDEWQRPE